ncbi:MAG TPA: putative toxin-antitoxin system toxin component, PIN family [Mycobacteriales bacterium]|jgi:putative PIN family toxin of toxin-antitoxin system|nr:putative toxin-antitoxin system toxin component, PIN family [Mycobacteriales bacterium]
MRVVADTNVLVAAVIAPDGTCGRLLIAATEGRWTVVASPRLVDELSEVLRRRKFRRWLSVDDARRFVSAVAALAEFHDDPVDAPAMTRDPDDDYLFALAATSRADAIVSGDEHLLEISDAGVAVLTPAGLLAQVER